MTESVHARPMGAALALPVVCIAQFMVALDVAIVNIALPSIQSSLHFSTVGLAWVVGAYTLAYGGLLLLGGRAADLFGRRRVFQLGLGLFVLGSLGCGIAQTSGELITTRFIQGIGAAAASPSALSLIPVVIPPARRVGALAAYAAMTGFGVAAGELLGGVLSGEASWRWVFWINVPVGVAVLIASPSALAGDPGRSHGRPRALKAPAVLTATAAAVCVVYGSIWAGGHSWGSAPTVAALVAAAVLVTVFVSIEIRGRDPLLPPSIVQGHGRGGTYLTAFLLYGCVYSIFFLVTVFDQELAHYSAVETGLAFLPVGLTIIAATRVARRMLAMLSAQSLIVLGSALVVASAILLEVMDLGETYFALQFPALLALGVGAGLATVGNTVISVSGLERAHVGLASGILGASRQIGGSLGVAIVPAIATTAATHYAHREVLSHALTAGFRTGFFVTAGIALVALAVNVASSGPRSPAAVR